MDIRTIAVKTHGRYLMVPPGRRAKHAVARLLVGFHGYGERAEIMMERLQAIDLAGAWWKVSVQALNRFYTRGDREVVASWMTREDRELAIEDNLEYVRAVVHEIGKDMSMSPQDIVYVGYSQGAATAWRSAIFGPAARGLIVYGGDVPPDVMSGPLDASPPVLLGRGREDGVYTAEQFARDRAVVAGKVAVTACEVAGGHEWPPAFTEAAARFLADED
jgi:predicted esterase